MPAKLKLGLSKLVLASLSILVILVFLEGLLALAHALRGRGVQNQRIPLHVLDENHPAIYRLNPEHPEVSAQALRGREYDLTKPEGTFRILLLGDSVTFGDGVPFEETFAVRLENLLGAGTGDVEVINSGVDGYTAYNELQFYLREGRRFDPDLVVVCFCLNDIVDPLPHWKIPADKIPPDAIPNPEYHKKILLPRLSRQVAGAGNWLKRSNLYRFAVPRIQIILQKYIDDENYTDVGGRRWPTFLTSEDPLSIEVLCDYHSPEWDWLRGIYDQLKEATGSDGVQLAIVGFPLEYQLEEGYPFVPLDNLARYCRERDIPFLDLLPPLQEARGEKMFFGVMSDYLDIWHLTPAGHRIVAETMTPFLQEGGLLR